MTNLTETVETILKAASQLEKLSEAGANEKAKVSIRGLYLNDIFKGQIISLLGDFSEGKGLADEYYLTDVEYDGFSKTRSAISVDAEMVGGATKLNIDVNSDGVAKGGYADASTKFEKFLNDKLGPALNKKANALLKQYGATEFAVLNDVIMTVP